MSTPELCLSIDFCSHLSFCFPLSLPLQALIDHDTYYMDLNDAKHTNVTTWKHEYSAKVACKSDRYTLRASMTFIAIATLSQAAYNMSGMSAADWAGLVDRLSENSTLFQTYYK